MVNVNHTLATPHETSLIIPLPPPPLVWKLPLTKNARPPLSFMRSFGGPASHYLILLDKSFPIPNVPFRAVSSKSSDLITCIIPFLVEDPVGSQIFKGNN